ncbi:SLC13 family permease [Tsuneonella sp. HG222]
MTFQQGMSFAVLAGTIALFIWGRWRYDLVAVAGLIGGLLTGVVPADKAFAGFSDDIVIIVGSALVVSAAVARSGVIEQIVARFSPLLKSFTAQLIMLVAAVALMSAFVKNIGALAIMMPIAFQMARKLDVPISRYLMPMAFGALLGGLMTLVGTSPNIIVASLREEMTGQPFAMFDFFPVGATLALVGVAFLAVGHRLLPGGQVPAIGMGEALAEKSYVTEAMVEEGSRAEGLTLGDLVDDDGGTAVTTVLRAGSRLDADAALVLEPGDIVVMHGEAQALERKVADMGLALEGRHRDLDPETSGEELRIIEAVIGSNSILVGEAAGRIELHKRYGINLLAVGRSGVRFTERLGAINLRAGDLIVLQGVESELPRRLRELDCLPLAEREVRLGGLSRSILPLLILGVAMALTAVGAISVQIAFFGAAAATVMIGALPLREAYSAVEWPILIMLAALIPVSQSIQDTGGTTLIADGLASLAQGMSPIGALALIMVAAMALTPFLNNAATVLVMAPIAAGFAQGLDYRPDGFLMAVAVGAACDFLTPIGHQCNTLVMGPGGYRFGDYWRLGLPLSILVIVVGVPMIALTWPA